MKIYYITNSSRTELYWGKVEDLTQTDFINRLNSVYHKSFRVRDVPHWVNVNGLNGIRALANTGASIHQVT